MKIYDTDGHLWDMIDAGGDTWGAAPNNQWGHDAPMPPGHYKLGAPQSIAPPSKAEGKTQISVLDIDEGTLASLVTAGRASESGLDVTISGVAAPIGGMAEFARDGIMIHGGGSNDPEPFLPFQPLCKTEGCTRVHNADLDRLTAFVSGRMSGNIVVYTAIGSPLTLGN
ncbi:MAG: hypothetical protein NVSMB64_14350 [Candidatus Velthaea sp.]